MTLLTNACRVLLAIVFMVSGFVKAVDPVGFSYKLGEYATAFGIELSSAWLQFAAILIACAEFLSGLFLITGVYVLFTALLVFVVMLFYTPFTLYIALENPVPDCGCFGDAFLLSNWETFAKNLLLLLVSIPVCFRSSLIKRRVSAGNRWLVLFFGLAYIGLASGISAAHLPVIDFRPFAIGTDLRSAVNATAMDGAPLIGDFCFIDLASDEDISAAILENPGYTVLLVLPSLETADENRVDKLNDLYDFCKENGVAFYAATSSDEEEMSLWCKRTGAEYPLYWSDDVALKTMIRANPGVLLLHDGVVVEKWDAADVPLVDDMSLDDFVRGKRVGYVAMMRGWKFWMLFFAIPMALILFSDVISGAAKRKADKKRVSSDAESDNAVAEKENK